MGGYKAPAAPDEPPRMYLHFSDRSRYGSLHLSTALEDWDMVDELQQCTTTDQTLLGADEKGDQRSLRRRQSMEVSPCKSEEESPAKSPFRPTLWLVVDPNIVIPCPEVHPPREPHPTPTFSPDAKARPRADCSTSDDEALTSTGEPCTEDDRWSASSPPGAPLRRVGSQVPKAPCKTWPRPPINYCTLISLALWNSEDGSLNVQQIYSFVREHFPFFRAAPDGWKNTVRHNLCFSSSFEKSSGWACTDGPRRSCLWKLTRLGSRKFRAEIKILTDDLLHVLRRSMNKPDPSSRRIPIGVTGATL